MSADLEYLGPDGDLIDLIDKAYQSPALGALSEEESDELRERLIRCRTWDDVAPADQQLLTRGVREVEAGRSPTWQDPESWGADWSAEDAELDDEAKALTPDDEGWVGV